MPALALAILVSAPAVSPPAFALQDADSDKAAQEKAKKETKGPSVGEPASIIPGPYFKKGTITLSARPKKNQDGNIQEGEETPRSAFGIDDDLYTREAIEEGALVQLDPSGIAATDEDALEPPIFWGNHDRSKIAGFINGLHQSGPLPTIHKLAENFARKGQILPAPQSDEEVDQFLKARLSALRRFGDGSAYVSLINRLPKDRDWSRLARYRVEAALVTGKLMEACTIAAEQSNITSEPYWLKINALCYAVEGNRAGVDFQIGILEETTTISPVFYSMIDQLLIEAEEEKANAGGDAITNIAPTEIYQPFPVSILEASMARLTEAIISDLSPKDPDPLAIPMLISQPGLNREARVELVELGVRQNWLTVDVLQEFVATLDISVDEEALAFRLYDTDDRFLIDLALARQIANKENSIDDRMQALELATARAARNNTTAGLAKLHLALIKDIIPSSEMLPYAVTIGRLAMLTGNYSIAERWFSLIRSLPAGSDDTSDEALVSLWPLMVVAGHTNNLPPVNDTILYHWWSALGESGDRFDKASRLFSIFEGLGYPITEKAWGWLEDGPSGVAGKAISPAHWRRFLIASNSGQPMDIHLSLLPLFENDETVEPALLGSVIGTLTALGDDRLARDLALESLLHAGL